MNLAKIAVALMNGELPPTAEEDLYRARMSTCTGCEHFARLTQQCKRCWCFMDLKTRLLEAQCPEGKW